MKNSTTDSRANMTVHTLLAACLLAGIAAQPVLAQTASAPAAPALVAKPKPTREVPFKAPNLAALAHEPNGAEILYGYRLMTQTKKLLPHNVGAAMNCTSCHLGGGFVPHSSAFVGQNVLYPMYNGRAARVVSMADRINGCMMRSMNGKPIPKNSPEMKAMLAFMAWMSKDVPADAKVKGAALYKISTSIKPDPVRGKAIYAERCAACHGIDGQGSKNAKGEYVFPPLWGPDSFNIGAGMARTYTAAGFVKGAMPVADSLHPPTGVGRMSASARPPEGGAQLPRGVERSEEGGSMSDQDAVDVAAYFSHQPRPDFPMSIYDWPKGGAPKDVRYCLVSLGNCTPAEIAKAPMPPGGK